MAEINRNTALELLHEYTKSESLRRHALAVEACVRAYARQYGQDEELWGITGLLHDFDYERWPNLLDHPMQGNAILRQHGYPEEMLHAILGHAAEATGVERTSQLDKVLFACDELSGFLTACALVKPGRSLAEVEPRSVKKKLKDKAFARSVNRDDIRNGAIELGVDLEEHIQFCIDAMLPIAEELGLAGVPASA